MPEITDRNKQDDEERTVVEFHGSRAMYLVNTAIGIVTFVAMIVIAIVHLL